MDTIAREVTERGEVVLRRDDDNRLELRVNGVFVMDTAQTRTEQALATESLALTAQPRRVLVGGLGLGFTVLALLEDPRVGLVTVAEIEPPVVAWMRDGTVPHGPPLLADDRVRVRTSDVAEVLGHQQSSSLDMILLDVDNGPDFLVHHANAAIYTAPFLHTCRDRLAPDGTLAVWSSAPAPALRRAVAETFDGVTEVVLPVRLQERSDSYTLYLGRVAA